MADQSLPQLTDEELQALQDEAKATRTTLRQIENRIQAEWDRRAALTSGYRRGDEIEVRSGRGSRIMCVSRISGTSYGTVRLRGRRVLTDGTLGKEEREIWQAIIRKVGFRDLVTGTGGGAVHKKEEKMRTVAPDAGVRR